MTPDELRRMDNDLCIIFEKGVKPIKAEKFYYFKTTMARKLSAHVLNHNTIDRIDRGTWRKYNPYNPYVEDDKKGQVENLKIESLDDLFNDDESNEYETENEPKRRNEIKVEPTVSKDAPILPGEETEDELDSDLQKELEAKFDELFGPLEEDD